MHKIIVGHTRVGKSFARCHILSNELITEYIIKKHLNNNNWLKAHEKPMIRKGNPWYSRAKELKGVSCSEFILLESVSEMGGFEISDEKSLGKAVKFIWGKIDDWVQQVK